MPPGCRPLYPADSFYLQHLDVLTLSELAEEHQLALYVPVQPGAFVHPAEPLLWVYGQLDEDLQCTLCDCFTLDRVRSFDQDPRFGCSVLSEIASRALSPAVNDPGTAIDILGRGVRLFAPWAQGPAAQEAEVSCQGVWLTPLALDDLFDDLFGPIARDGAGRIDVQLRLVKSLQALAAQGACFAAPARRLAREALALGEQALVLEVDRQRLREQVEMLLG
ncbi:DUF2254 family protein [Halopseudomonas pachastrellae]|nr:DUF2254 family protein [Halopseudomonas pachastrellae]